MKLVFRSEHFYNTKTARQKQLDLMRLEEEQSLKMEYIHRKYQILNCDEDDSADESHTYSVDSLYRTLKKTPSLSSKLQRKKVFEKENPTSSDEEREMCNRMVFNDSDRIYIEKVKNSYDDKRYSAVHGNIGPNKSVQQPPMNYYQPTVIGNKRETNIGPNKSVQQPPMNSYHHNPMTQQSYNAFSNGNHRQNVGDQSSSHDQGQTMSYLQVSSILSSNHCQQSEAVSKQQQQIIQCEQPQNSVHNFNTNFTQPIFTSFPESSQFAVPKLIQTNVISNHLPSNSVTTFNKDSSGYVGFAGQLTQTHIAARHVFSKDLPQFWGKPVEWPMFLSALKNSTKACGFSDDENLGRLQRCLKGDAMDLVRSHLLHASSVPGVLETLHMLFGRPSMIINSLLEKIQETPAPKADDLSSLIKFAISVQSLSATIQSSGSLEYLRNPTLIQSITDKLPTQTQLNWASFKHSAGDVDLAVMGNWLFKLAQIATEVINPSSLQLGDKKERKNKNQQNDSNSTNYVNAHSDDGDSKKFKCRGCNTDSKHALDSCKKFKELSVEERWNFIKKHKLCGCCFGTHKFYKCSKKKKCGLGGCTREHNLLLHNGPDNSPSKTTIATSDVATANAHRTTSTTKFPDVFRIVPVILSTKEKSMRIFAYLDDGSNLTSLEESVARKLNAFGTKEPLCIKWSFGNREMMPDSRQLTVKIRGVDADAEEYVLNHVRTVKKLMLPTQSMTKDWLAQYSHFDDVPITTYTNATPQMIIGLEYSKLMVSLDTREGEWSQPLACKTRIGWVVQGPNDEDKKNFQKQKYSLNMCECQSNDKNLHQLVSDFFSAENIDAKVPDKVLESKDDARAKQILENTMVKKGNHYEVGLLWKRDDIQLPNSYYMAKRRLECVESKMKKDPVLAQRMREYIQDSIDKKYIRKLSEQEKNRKGPRTWYLPIFPVFNPKKPEKLRVVWDGAAKVDGISLNSVLLTGPDLLEPLPDVQRRPCRSIYVATV